MKITHYAQGTNQYKKKKKSKVRVILNWITIILMALVIYSAFNSKPTIETPKVQQVDGLTVEQQAQLERQYELAKQETILKNKKDKLDAEYKAASSELEAQLEAVRAEKMSFK